MSIYAENLLDPRYTNTSTSLIFDMVPEAATVLDIGCSTGNLAKELVDQKRCKVDGIEIDSEDAQKARKVCRKVLEKDVNTYDFSDFKENSYDCVIICNVLEHLTNPEAALRNCKKLLKKDGRVLFSVPNIANITTRIDLLFGNFDYEDEGILDRTHYKYFTQKTLFQLFSDTGYEVSSYLGSTKTINKNLLKKRLKTIGIELSEVLEKHLYSEQAHVYEHVGSIKPGSMPTTLPTKLIDNKIDHIQQGYIKRLEENTNELKKYVTKTEKDNIEKDTEIRRLNQEIDERFSNRLRRKLKKSS